ncbi:histidine phosphatase family protein, partial [Candidatus Gracilibacteria bacterium]|nr:histidine phosphatase family protein [Candidatus Gracilibacteria bacterium]
YSFFTTYANIDKWESGGTEVWFSRHAESTSNVASKMSDGSDDPHITQKGREQAKNAGKDLKSQGKNFDVIIHTDRIRTYDTARLIAEEIGFQGEYIIDDGFAEQTAGEYANKTLIEIAEMGGLPVDTSHVELRKLYKNNSSENIAQFEERILTTYENILTKYAGKRILIVAHAGTSRPILHKYMGMSHDQAHYDTTIANAHPYRLMTTPLANPLDQWILSKLQVLISQVHDAMEGYDISRGCRAITSYMDELTNWYVRLSRRRFWESGMTADKQSAYETLYTVLTEVSKLLAPLMPFLSENIYQGLTGRESVHLEYITLANKHLVANDLNRDMEICEHIVSLGLALRSRKNIRVRQPLASVTITRELSEYYKGIIRDELNVKEVRYENPENLAKKICKPDARKIGPKYGKDVQKVITEAKNGNFLEKENGIIDVGGFILEPGEYTIEYLPLEGTLDVEGGYGMVVGLDTIITESLQLEGYARDIVRLIQDMRKEADYQVTDRITLSISPVLDSSSLEGVPTTGGGVVSDIIAKFGDMITSETLSTFAVISIPDLEKVYELEEEVTFTIRLAR